MMWIKSFSKQKDKAFILPSVIIASIVMLIVLSVSVSATVTVRTVLKEQYYAQLSQTAGEAGLEYAKSCLRSNSNKPLWTDAKPLKPNTDCGGNELVTCPTTSTDSACSVLLNGNIRTTFSVPLPSVDSAGYSTYVRYSGFVELLRTSSKAVWRTYEQRGNWQVDFATYIPPVSSGLVLNLDAGDPSSYSGGENLVASSTYNATNWSNVFTANATLTTGITAPDGTASAVRLSCSTTGSSLLRVNFPAFTPNGTDTYTTSFYVRLISGNTSFASQLTSDLHDGTPSGNYLPQLVTNQWIRVSFTGVPSSASKSFIDLLSDNSNNYVLDYWGVQVEKSTSATVYTPTFTSPVTRSTTWKDLSGNARNGTLVNGVGYSSSNGGSLTFDGVNDAVTLPDGIESAYSYNSTMEIWARQTTNKDVEYFKIGTGQISSTNESGLWYTANTMNYYFYITAAGDRPFIKATYSANIADGKWYHIVGTFAGNSTSGTATIYINGQVVNSSSALSYSSTLNNTGISYASAYTLVGNVAIARLYNRALSASEVLQNYNSAKDRFD